MEDALDDPTHTPSDEDLVRRARTEPLRPAFKILYQRHEALVFRFLLRLTRDRPLAEDLLQETFLRAYRHLDRFDTAKAFRPWLVAIARNAALNALRNRRQPLPLSDGYPASAPEVSRGAASREEAARARAALDTLPDATRTLLIQRHGLGMKLTELAESWDCTERTIRNRLHAAGQELAVAMWGLCPAGGTP